MSRALDELEIRLVDVDELITAHETLTGRRRGRPAQSAGGAITRGGVLLLYAATEVYVENLFEEAATLLFVGMSDDDKSSLFTNTSRKLNNANAFGIEMLFFNLGMPWALNEIRWPNFSNAKFRTALNRLVATRNELAHGRWSSAVRLQSLRGWLHLIEMFAPRFEQKVANYLIDANGSQLPRSDFLTRR